MASPFEIHYALSELADHERFTPGPLAQASTLRAFGAQHSLRTDNSEIRLSKYKLIRAFSANGFNNAVRTWAVGPGF